MNDVGILEVLENLRSLPQELEQAAKQFSDCLSTILEDFRWDSIWTMGLVTLQLSNNFDGLFSFWQIIKGMKGMISWCIRVYESPRMKYP